MRGVTLFEVLIVVAILAMVSGGVAVAALRYGARARVKHAGTEARTIRTAVGAWIFEGLAVCPTVVELREHEYLDSGTRGEDPWGRPYRVRCGKTISVRSSGPDRTAETSDDIVVPPLLGEEADF